MFRHSCVSHAKITLDWYGLGSGSTLYLSYLIILVQCMHMKRHAFHAWRILWWPETVCMQPHVIYKMSTGKRGAKCSGCDVVLWHMMTSSNGNIFRVTGHLCGKFTGPRWISRTKASDAELWCFFDLHLNKRLSKQPWGWWFETPEWSLWRHRNDKHFFVSRMFYIVSHKI